MGNKSIIIDALILFAITLVAGFALGLVYEVTKEPIEQQQLQTKLEAYKTVFPEAADFMSDDSLTDTIKNFDSVFDSADSEFGNVSIDEIVEAQDANAGFLGYVITATSKDGYNGDITLSVGVSKENKIVNIEILQSSETTGLGSKASEPGFKNQYQGKSSVSVTKSGNAGENEIDAISGATITSNAVTNAVNAAVYFAENGVSNGGGA